jgi:hypothetical protein
METLTERAIRLSSPLTGPPLRSDEFADSAIGPGRFHLAFETAPEIETRLRGRASFLVSMRAQAAEFAAGRSFGRRIEPE